MLFRIHHCIADGIALARVMLSLTDTRPDAGFAARPRREHGRGRAPAGRAREARRRGGRGCARGGRRDAPRGHGLARPPHARARAGRHRGARRRHGREAAGLAAGRRHGPARPRSAAAGAWRGPRRSRSTASRQAAHRADGKVNDILVAAVTGALRSLPGASTTRCRTTCTSWCRSTCARSTSRCRRDLGNDFALILLALPVGIEDRDERLREVKTRMDAIKNSHEGPISYGILSAMGTHPPAGGGPADPASSPRRRAPS